MSLQEGRFRQTRSPRQTQKSNSIRSNRPLAILYTTLEKLIFIEREINRLGNIKGSEDTLNVAISMVREGKTRDDIINKTGLREDEVEAIYTYYKK